MGLQWYIRPIVVLAVVPYVSDVDILGDTLMPRTSSERMTARVRVLEMIDRRRRETGDGQIGSGIERLILAMSLAEIEEATARDASTPDLE